jgi:cytochrome c oxidase assembly protein Cox11
MNVNEMTAHEMNVVKMTEYDNTIMIWLHIVMSFVAMSYAVISYTSICEMNSYDMATNDRTI